MITLNTSLGNIIIELDFKNTPETAKNFLAYCESNYFADTIFHRVIPGFMIQGGGLTADMQPKPGQAPIKNEAKNGGKNNTGTLAMARTSDPHSASSQFFINTVDNDFLNFRDESIMGWGYCVFGQVIEGMDVVKKIEAAATSDKAGHENVPVETISITGVSIDQAAVDTAKA